MTSFAYLPHTEDDVAHMLAHIGVERIEDLFQDIPGSLVETGAPKIPAGMSEPEVYEALRALSEKNQPGVSFLGAGSYDHIIPSTVGYITGRSEFATAHPPYQAEVSQGALQAMFEFQTMIRMLTGLPAPNASLYDGATAATEACAMTLQAKRRSKRLVVSQTVHPHTRAVIRTYFGDLGAEVTEVGQDRGETDWEALREAVDSDTAGVLLQTPNAYGIVENLEGVCDMLHDRGVLAVISTNPMALSVLRSQGSWGADIAVGDAQPFGLASSFGGPSVGYIASSDALMRKMPGRIVGETVDSSGRRAFVLTLQAREQHIKRERATSNICTNQALAALAVAVYLSTVGKQGLRSISEQNVHKSHYLAQAIERNTHAKLRFPDRPFFNEFVLHLGRNASEVVTKIAKDGYFVGVPMAELGFQDTEDLLVAVTEKRTRSELDRYVELIGEATQ